MRGVRYALLTGLLACSQVFAAQQPVNVGSVANDGTGDPARTAFQKLNANDAELYAQQIPATFWTWTPSFQGSGSPGLFIQQVGGTGLNIARQTTGSADTADFFCHRAANYAGGNSASVNACLYSKTITTAGANSYEWNAVFFLDNFNTAANGAQNVAMYNRAIKESTGATWANTFELDDSLADPTTGSVTSELDLWANGTDANNERLIQHIVGGPGSYGGTPHINQGTRYSANNGLSSSSANAIIDDCWVCMTGDYKYGIHFSGGSTTAGAAAIIDDRSGSNIVYGLNLGGAYTGGAIFIRDNKSIILSTDQTAKFKYNSVSNCVEYLATATVVWSVCDDGHVAASGLVTGAAGITITGAAVNLNNGSNFNVNIGNGTSTGAITVGGTTAGNTVNLASVNTEFGGVKYASSTAPTIASGFNTASYSITAASTAAFKVTVGTSTATTTGVLTLPAAANGWACSVADVTTPATHFLQQTATGTTSVTVTDYVRTTGVAQNMANSDVLVFHCGAF